MNQGPIAMKPAEYFRNLTLERAVGLQRGSEKAEKWLIHWRRKPIIMKTVKKAEQVKHESSR